MCTMQQEGWKRKSAAPEADAPEPIVKVAPISNAPESARGCGSGGCEDEIAVREIENQWADPRLGSV